MHNKENKFDVGEMLDEGLKTDPCFSLSDNFADILADKVARKYVWQQYIKEFLIYLGVFVGMAVVSGAMAFICFGADWKEWLNYIVSNAGIVVGINILLIFILFADRVLLRYFMFNFEGGSWLT